MDNSPLFFAKISDQRVAVDKLIKESRPDADYYLYLTLAGMIAALGLLNDNPVVIIGAMLIAPALFPILSLGMGVVTASRSAIVRALKVIGHSFTILVISGLFFAFIITTTGEANESMRLASSPNLTSILIALFSGIIASYSWVKQSQSALLPGVAVAVSLVPPLANIGVGIALFSKPIFAGSLLMFLLNLLGIFFGSMLIFAVFGFSGMRSWQDKRLVEEEEMIEKQKEEIEETLKQVNGDSKEKNGKKIAEKTDKNAKTD